MSRYRLILEGEFDERLGVVGVGEQVAMRLEDLGDLRVVGVYNILAGCLICQHGEPVEGSGYGKVMCRSRGMEHLRFPTDHCMRFVQIRLWDCRDSAQREEYERRLKKFNRLVGAEG